MKGKNILFVLLMALPAMLFTSCLKDDDEVFDEASSQRMQKYLNEAKAALRSAENGWVMDYYVGDDQVYGGYAFLVKFDSLTCTAASENITTPCTSYYKLTTDNGPTLTFDSYNEVLHELATPSSGNYEGYHADFEFVIMSATQSEVVLKGKKTGNRMVLRPLSESMDSYLAKVKSIQDGMSVDKAIGKIDTTTVNVNFDMEGRQYELVCPYDTAENVSGAFTFTDKGIRLYEAVSVEGKTVSEFAFDSATKRFTCLDEGSSDIVLDGFVPVDYRPYEAYAGDYYLVYQVADENDNYQDARSEVTLVPSEDGKNYLMKGLNSNYDVLLTYNRFKGCLDWNTQIIGVDGANYIWMNAANFAGGGSLYPAAAETGMRSSWNMDEQNPVYEWSSNDSELIVSDSWCLWKTDASGNSLGQVQDSKWAMDGYIVLLYVKSLEKR